MPDLTKKESAYFILFSMGVLSIVITTLFLWSQTQESCWNKYSSEQQAILACENES